MTRRIWDSFFFLFFVQNEQKYKLLFQDYHSCVKFRILSLTKTINKIITWNEINYTKQLNLFYFRGKISHKKNYIDISILFFKHDKITKTITTI